MIPDRRCDQRGEALLESMLAIMILSVIVAAAYGGLQLAMRASTMQKEAATAGVMLRNSAEELLDPRSGYIDLAGCDGRDMYRDLAREPGYGEVAAGVRFVEVPNGHGRNAARGAGARAGRDEDDRDEDDRDEDDRDEDDRDEDNRCPDADPGLQEIELSVTTPSGDVHRLLIVKRRQ